MTEICVTLRERSAAAAVAAASRCREMGFGLVEIRLDQFDRPSWSDEDQSALRDAGVRDVITLRPEWDGGGFRGSEEDRSRVIMDALRTGPDLVDLEYRMAGGMRSSIISAASRSGVGTIVSYHDHARTPEASEIATIMEAMFGTGADTVKLALRCATIEDASSIIGSAMAYKGTERRYSMMGMGPFGHVTRVLSPFMGCEMAYAKLGDPGNTDQIDAMTLKAIWEALGE